MQGSPAVWLLGAHVCAVVEEPLPDLGVSLIQSNMKWSRTVCTARIHVGTVREQQLGNLDVSLKDRSVQWSAVETAQFIYLLQILDYQASRQIE